MDSTCGGVVDCALALDVGISDAAFGAAADLRGRAHCRRGLVCAGDRAWRPNARRRASGGSGVSGAGLRRGECAAREVLRAMRSEARLTATTVVRGESAPGGGRLRIRPCSVESLCGAPNDRGRRRLTSPAGCISWSCAVRRRRETDSNYRRRIAPRTPSARSARLAGSGTYVMPSV